MEQNKYRQIQHRPLFVVTASLLLLSLSTMSGFARLTRLEPQAKSGSTFVAVVSRAGANDGEGNLDAVVLVENGKLRQPYPEYNEAAMRKFASEYFATGKKYRVTFGGGEIGNLTIKGFDTGCNNIHAKASVEDNGKIPAYLSALATDSDSLGRKPSSRRAPTQAERQAMDILVAQIYRSRGTPLAVYHTVVTINLTATDLDGDGKFELIGSFVAQTKTGARRDLLLIADPVGATRLPIPEHPVALKFKPALVKLQAYKLPPEGFDSAIDFVDQLDLDGDGVAEVFVQQHGFDAYGYSIYKKSAGRWRAVYTTTGDAC
ncbi:MAG: hypothetical protein ABJA18_00920 [bacterium]